MAEGAIERARRWWAVARRVLVLTGAGVSADSGVPTFRGPEGLWRRFRPEQLATPQAFAADPVLVWSWYMWRRERIAGCVPNAAHHALAGAALERPGRVTIVTQNVDGLHALAAEQQARSRGCDPAPARPLCLHGGIFRNRCTGCGRRWEDRRVVAIEDEASLPRCERCGALARPDVVWFGEPLEPEVLERAFGAARAADLCLVVGTSAQVAPACHLPDVVVGGGGRVIEVNPVPSGRWTGGADAVVVACGAAQAVARIVGEAGGGPSGG